MNVLLVQPPSSPEPIGPGSLPGKHCEQLAPPWDLLCLRSYLLEHSRHIPNLTDCRLFSDLELELVETIKSIPVPRIMVVNTTSHALGQAAAVLAIAKRNFPDMKTVICGEFPSQFPEYVLSMTSTDYALAGDPEPILRNLLDYIDVEQRLQRTPGLIFNGATECEPYWLDRLHGLSVPDWQGLHWNAYQPSITGNGPILAEARVSRGHSGTPADRAFGNSHEPLRIWPLGRIASVLQKCANMCVSEVFMSDPPGIWTPSRIEEWCAALKRIRNRQPWSLRILPRQLSKETLINMKYTACRRIVFLFPTCEPQLFERYGTVLEHAEILHTIEMAKSRGLRICARFWIGGPEEDDGEQERVVELIRKLDYVTASLHPFPFAMHSPLYKERSQANNIPHLEDWIRWSRDPWIADRPVALWRGRAGIEQFKNVCAEIERSVAHSPKRIFKKLLGRLGSTNWIRVAEEKATGLMARLAFSHGRDSKEIV